jgi:hypothetical protein
MHSVIFSSLKHRTARVQIHSPPRPLLPELDLKVIYLVGEVLEEYMWGKTVSIRETMGKHDAGNSDNIILIKLICEAF